MNAALEALVNQGGVLGALVVIFALVIAALWWDGRKRERELLSQLTDLHELRVKDATDREAALRVALEQSTTAIEQMAKASEAEADAVNELQQELIRRRR